MKVLFLDVDGVLNSTEGWCRDNPHTSTYMTPECVDQLKELLNKRCKDVAVVVSSTWRKYFDIKAFRAMFDILGLPGDRIIGYTPEAEHLSSERGHEIQAWLDGHPEVERFVILDDDADMVHLMPHLVQTDPMYGLTEERINEIARRFA